MAVASLPPTMGWWWFPSMSSMFSHSSSTVASSRQTKLECHTSQIQPNQIESPIPSCCTTPTKSHPTRSASHHIDHLSPTIFVSRCVKIQVDLCAPLPLLPLDLFLFFGSFFAILLLNHCCCCCNQWVWDGSFGILRWLQFQLGNGNV